MESTLPAGIRVGGSALPDGVMMLTTLAVAIARESSDGTLSVESFPLPKRNPSPLEKLPFVRILPKLVSQMTLVVRGWKPSKGKQLPVPLLGAVIGVGVLSGLLNGVFASLSTTWHAVGSSLLQLLLFFGVIGITRFLPSFGRIWRFHGGEHQAIAAYEAGVPLTVENTRTRSLYHPRCGTNLAIIAMVLMVPGMVAGSVVAGIFGYVITVLSPLPALCVAFEAVMWGQGKKTPILWPGMLFQRLTVATPGPAESRAGIAALEAALAEHARVEAAEVVEVSTVVPQLAVSPAN